MSAGAGVRCRPARRAAATPRTGSNQRVQTRVGPPARGRTVSGLVLWPAAVGEKQVRKQPPGCDTDSLFRRSPLGRNRADAWRACAEVGRACGGRRSQSNEGTARGMGARRAGCKGHASSRRQAPSKHRAGGGSTGWCVAYAGALGGPGRWQATGGKARKASFAPWPAFGLLKRRTAVGPPPVTRWRCSASCCRRRPRRHRGPPRCEAAGCTWPAAPTCKAPPTLCAPSTARR